MLAAGIKFKSKETEILHVLSGIYTTTQRATHKLKQYFSTVESGNRYSYGTDKAIFGYGYTTVNVSMTNLVSNTGVVAADVTGVGTARYGLAAAGYGV